MKVENQHFFSFSTKTWNGYKIEQNKDLRNCDILPFFINVSSTFVKFEGPRSLIVDRSSVWKHYACYLPKDCTPYCKGTFTYQPINALKLLLKLLSGSDNFDNNWEWFHKIFKVKIVVHVLINISPSNIFKLKAFACKI